MIPRKGICLKNLKFWIHPFNTSVSGGDIVINEKYFEDNSDVEYYTTKEMPSVIKFDLRIRELNKAY